MNKLALILICTFSSTCLFAEPIPDFAANYSIHLNGIQAGELKRSLITNNDGSRLFKSETQAKGLFALLKPEVIIETSLWSGSEKFIKPLKYRYIRTGGRKNKRVALDFNWVTRQVYIDDAKHPWYLDIENETLDKLVYQLALMSDLEEKKTTFNYRIADGGKIKNYSITKMNKEAISTPMGKTEVIKLTRKRSRPTDRKTTLWCSPALNYIPVMLEHIEKDGTIFTAKLRRLRGISTEGVFEPNTPPIPFFD